MLLIAKEKIVQQQYINKHALNIIIILKGMRMIHSCIRKIVSQIKYLIRNKYINKNNYTNSILSTFSMLFVISNIASGGIIGTINSIGVAGGRLL